MIAGTAVTLILILNWLLFLSLFVGSYARSREMT